LVNSDCFTINNSQVRFLKGDTKKMSGISKKWVGFDTF